MFDHPWEIILLIFGVMTFVVFIFYPIAAILLHIGVIIAEKIDRYFDKFKK